MGVNGPALTEWVALNVFAPKKDRSLHFWVYYRNLNAVTIGDAYPTPRIDEYIDSLADSQMFSTLDANFGYWQVDIEEADRDKTSITSHHGLYRFLRMPFGLKNFPGTFQMSIGVILSDVR